MAHLCVELAGYNPYRNLHTSRLMAGSRSPATYVHAYRDTGSKRLHKHTAYTASYSTIQHHTASYSTIEHHTAPYSTIQHHTAPYSTIQHHTAPYSTIQHHTASYSTIEHHTAPYSIIQHHRASYSTIQHHTAPYSTIQHHTASYSTIQTQAHPLYTRKTLCYVKRYRRGSLLCALVTAGELILNKYAAESTTP